MKRILNIALVFIFIFPCSVRAQNESPHKLSLDDQGRYS